MKKNLDFHPYTVSFIALTLIYILSGTGIHGDDYRVIIDMNANNVWSPYSLGVDKLNSMIFNLPTYYGFWWAYYIFGLEYQFAYDIVKIVSHGLAIYMVYKFAKDYLPNDRALLASIVFIFYPLHDSTTYWYMTLPYIFVPAILLYAHHLVRRNAIWLASPLLFIGSIALYASPPYVFGLASIFAFEKKFKKAIIFIIPGIFYLAFYFFIKLNYPDVDDRMDSNLTIAVYLKTIIIQFISFIEASIGPSYWLKVIFSVNSMSLLSIIVTTVLASFFLTKVRIFFQKHTPSKPLFYGLVCIIIFSFALYSLTGRYSHSPFNLGNRTTVYGSLLIAFLLATFLPANKKSVIFLLIIFLMPSFGLSDHWKSWNVHQKIIIKNIKNNQELKKIEFDSTLIVIRNIYSKLGPFAHIEFFSMPWNVNAIFQDNVKTKNVVALTPNVVIKDGYIINSKFGSKYSLNGKLYVYDSERDQVRDISFKDVPELIKQQPGVLRHWVQLFKDTWIQDILILLSPRLSYLFV
jgi:hypothetical protein